MEGLLTMMVLLFVLAAMFDVSSFMEGKFLTHMSLAQPTQLVTIASVDQQEVGRGKGKELKVCVKFAEFDKPLGLNQTNLKTIAEFYTIDANQWIGKTVTLYRTKTQFGGETVLCIRICGPNQMPNDSIYDKLGNIQHLTAPVAAAPVQQPVAAPQQPAAPVQQPVAAPQPVEAPQPAAAPVQTPWVPEQNNPPSA